MSGAWSRIERLPDAGAGERTLVLQADEAQRKAIAKQLELPALHRLEASIRPENAPSRRVVEKLGFREEGVRVRQLHINGQWRDHLCYAITAEEVPAGLWPAFRALAGHPLLAIRGALSDILSAATAKRMKADVPDMDLCTVADVGHPPTLDKPEAREAIARWLTKVESAAS